MADETQSASGEEKGPLPRSREAVDWWLKKWGRQAVVDGEEPLTREDVERLIEANGGTAEGLHLAARNMRGAFLVGADLQAADLRRADLHGANLWKADLQGANLRETNLAGAYLDWADLQGADLRWADLQGASLLKANLQGADLGWADLQGAFLRWANLQGAVFLRANLEGAVLREANFREASLTDVTMSPDTNLEGVEWDPKYISALEQRGDYEAASAVYRRLKEWYRGAGMLTIAGEFHFREREASRKGKGQRLIRQFKAELAEAWRRLKGKDTSASPEK